MYVVMQQHRITQRCNALKVHVSSCFFRTSKIQSLNENCRSWCSCAMRQNGISDFCKRNEINKYVFWIFVMNFAWAAANISHRAKSRGAHGEWKFFAWHWRFVLHNHRDASKNFPHQKLFRHLSSSSSGFLINAETLRWLLMKWNFHTTFIALRNNSRCS